jgi:hypothetical protein
MARDEVQAIMGCPGTLLFPTMDGRVEESTVEGLKEVTK